MANACAVPLVNAKTLPVVETSSSCLTQCIAHNFEVINFSLLEGIGVGEFISSRNFGVGGYDWSISLYPDGFHADYKDHVSAFLTPDEGGGHEGLTVRFTFTVFGKDGQVWTLKSLHTFESPLRGVGWGFFIDKSSPLFRTQLRNSNDRFTVRCGLTVIGESQSEDVGAAPDIIVPEQNMHHHFEQMLKSGKGTDVTFDVDGRLFHAHRCVVAARSPVFDAQLFGPMNDKATIIEPIKVSDMEPSVFEELLHFIYTDSLLSGTDSTSSDSKNGGGDDDDKTASMQHLLVAADRYGLDRLRLMCEVSLCQGIDVKTVATTLALAEQHQFARLKGACLKFVASRDMLAVVMKTEGFKHLVASCPLIAAEILDKIAAEP